MDALKEAVKREEKAREAASNALIELLSDPSKVQPYNEARASWLKASEETRAAALGTNKNGK